MKNYLIPRQRITLIRDGSYRSEWKTFSNSAEAYQLGRQLYDGTDREQFHVITLDSKNRMIGVNMVSQGSLSQSVVHPREVYKPAIAANAAAVICMHNHPSGDPTPSREDSICTERLVQAGIILGIRMLDHVVCGETEHFSFADAGLIGEMEERYAKGVRI